MLSGNGFRSEAPRHDYIASTIQIGPWISTNNPTVEFFTEQELRHIHPDDYPNWVSKDISHRSDGLWRFPLTNKGLVFALEVELGRQTPERYRNIAKYYDANQTIARVFWAVRSNRQAERIHNFIKEEVGNGARFHNFLTVEDYFKKGWLSTLTLGHEAGRTMSDLVGLKKNELTPISDQNCIFDLSKCPTKSGNYKLMTLKDVCL